MSVKEQKIPQLYKEVGPPGTDDDYVDPHLKTPRDYGSDYSKLAMQGGHKDLLNMNEDYESMQSSRRQKGCDNLSDYNKVARQGGHRDLLRMDGDQQMMDGARKQKGCDNLSQYNQIAMQGGHRDLLVIEENKPSARKVEYNPVGGDWFSHNDNKGAGKPTAKPVPLPLDSINSTTDEKVQQHNGHVHQSNGHGISNGTNGKPIERGQSAKSSRAASNCLPGADGGDDMPRCGKKRFGEPSQKRDAPFATNW